MRRAPGMRRGLPKETLRIMTRRHSITKQFLGLQLLTWLLILGGFGVFEFSIVREQLFTKLEDSGQAVLEALGGILAAHPELFTAEALQPMIFRFAATVGAVER